MKVRLGVSVIVLLGITATVGNGGGELGVQATTASIGIKIQTVNFSSGFTCCLQDDIKKLSHGVNVKGQCPIRQER